MLDDNNIPETEDENCKAFIYDVIEKDLGVDISQIRFHAVHRVGKMVEDRCRPIIARFVCREDKDCVRFERGKIKKNPPPTLMHIPRKTTPKLFKMKEERR